LDAPSSRIFRAIATARGQVPGLRARPGLGHDAGPMPPCPLTPILLLVLAAVASRVGAQDPVEVARGILDGGGYQLELPEPDPALPPTAPRTGGKVPAALRPEVGAGVGLGLWILLGLGLVTALAGVAAASARSGRDVRFVGRSAGATPAEPPAPFDPGLAPLDEAERLAAAGRHGEAIRILLLRTIEALRARGGFAIAAWMTSREIQRRAPLEAGSRDALAALVDAVERSRFGGREPGGDEYAACAGAYRALLGGAGRHA
jgi:hypothetical protein